MALSGALAKKYFYSNTHCHWIEWSATQNIATNKSTVTVKFMSRFTSGYGTYIESAGNNNIRVNGSVVASNPYISGPAINTDITQFQTSIVIDHASDGTASFTLGGRHRLNSSHADYVYWNNVTFNLDRIPRTSSIGTISGDTIGSRVTVNITRADTSFSHKYTIKFPDTSTSKFTNVTVPVGNSSFYFDPPLSWCSDIAHMTSSTCYVYLDTYSGSTKIGSTVSKTFTLKVPTSVVPTLSSVTRTEANSAVSSVTSSFVKSLSKLYISASATGVYGSTIMSYKIEVNGQTITTASGTTTTNVLNSTGTKTITVTVTDSRGRTTSSTGYSYTVVDYNPPTITSLKATRRSSPSTTIDVVAKGTWSSLGTSNTTTYTLSRTLNGVTTNVGISPNSGSNGTLNNTYTLAGMPDTNSYGFTFKMVDRFGQSATASTTVGTAFVEFTIKAGVGVGIGKVHEQGVLDVNGNAYFNGVIYKGGTSIDSLYASSSHTHSGYVPTSRTVNSKALSSNITLSASDVGAASSSHGHSSGSLSSSVTYVSGVAGVTSRYCLDVVYLRFTYKPTQTGFTQGIVTMPAGYRPPSITAMSVATTQTTADAARTCRAYIGSNGQVTVIMSGTLPTYELLFSVTYVT